MSKPIENDHTDNDLWHNFLSMDTNCYGGDGEVPVKNCNCRTVQYAGPVDKDSTNVGVCIRSKVLMTGSAYRRLLQFQRKILVRYGQTSYSTSINRAKLPTCGNEKKKQASKQKKLCLLGVVATRNCSTLVGWMYIHYDVLRFSFDLLLRSILKTKRLMCVYLVVVVVVLSVVVFAVVEFV